MNFCILIYIVVIVELIIYCGADTHTSGTKFEYGIRVIYRRTLIDDTNKVPKDYTIMYNYFGSKYKDIVYMEIDVNVKSSGYINASGGGKKIIEAKIQIFNGLNVTATITLWTYGMEGIMMPNYGKLLGDEFNTKSLTFVYKRSVANSNQVKQFAQNAIGRRRKGDVIIYFESRNVTNASRFPSRAFAYTGNNEYITYVGFSFNSPTAMVMVNTSYVGEQEFNAVVYDMNTEHFVANMTIYGIRRVFRPDKFEGVI